MPKVISAEKKVCLKRCFNEYKADRPDFTNEDIYQRLSRIFEVSRCSIIDILKQDFENLKPSYCAKRPKTDVFLNFVFRKDLQNLIWEYNSKNEYFTLDTLLKQAKDNLEFDGERTTLYKILKSMGYKYKLVNGRKILCVFLRKFLQYQNSSENIMFVYLDETWIYQNGSCIRRWIHKNDLKSNPSKIKNEGKRFTILHAGCQFGFLEGCDLLLDTANNDRDYHKTMNGEIFRSSNTLSTQSKPATISENPIAPIDTSPKSLDSPTRINSLTNLIPSQSVLLSTAVVEVQDSLGQFQEVRILLDSASQANFITKNCAERLGLSRKTSTFIIKGLGGMNDKASKEVSCTLRSKNEPSIRFSINAILFDKICDDMPSVSFSTSGWTNLMNLTLADSQFNLSRGIDMLLGADIFPLILESGRLLGNSDVPTAMNTKFEDDPIFPGSFANAFRRLQSIERRLIKNPLLYEDYKAFMNEYLDLGHMQLLTNGNSSDGYYIPHHCVIKADSPSTKLRVVFDASCPSSEGKSLNDSLFVGPKLQKDILTILSRFRVHPIVFTADIRQMYRQILILPEHRKFQKILWRNSPQEPVQEYQLNTVTYGVSSSPFLAIRTLGELASLEKTRFPLASEVLVNDVYIDDIITGCSSIAEAHNLRDELIDLLSTAESDKCHISDPHTYNFLQTTNDYKVIKQLSNNKVLISTRKPLKIMEICKEEIKQEIIYGSILVSSGGNTCRIIVDQMKFDNTYSNYTYRTPLEIPLANFKMNKSVKLQQKHLEDFSKLHEEAEDMKSDIMIDPTIHLIHASATSIFWIIIIVLTITAYIV
ncbi:hypothetical protein TcasGA2_TC008524 [Tribolium castaneum]|uniref:Uncharacterized protein n=1 Tax=Tribolium castaneum TaxID=7070 RepID=D2A334_TRICA|nr:hypothetical protein TcasGA2_TC008524 [Tribolium castaneum]